MLPMSWPIAPRHAVEVMKCIPGEKAVPAKSEAKPHMLHLRAARHVVAVARGLVSAASLMASKIWLNRAMAWLVISRRLEISYRH